MVWLKRVLGWRGLLVVLVVALGCSGSTTEPKASAGAGAAGSSGVAPGGSSGTGGAVSGSSGAGPSAGMTMTAAGGRAADGGRASAGGTSLGGAGSAAGGSGGGNDAGGDSGAPGAGSGGAPGDLGPPGPDGFAIRVDLASDIEPTAPTTVGIVQWSLDKPGLTEAHVEFGLDTSYGVSAPVDLSHARFRTVLFGMKAKKTYHFRVVATDGSQTYTSDDRTVTTGARPDLLLLGDFNVTSPAQVDRGFFITSFFYLFGSGTDACWTAIVFDTDGDIVWWYTYSDHAVSGEAGIGRARLSADSQDIWLVQLRNGAAPLRRVSIDTLDQQTYDVHASHDIAAVSGDLMAFLDYGEEDCDSIFEIDKAGTVKEVFESEGVTNTGDIKPCHGNSVRYSKKEDVYVYSDDYQDVVIVGRDGTPKWSLRDKVSGGNESWGALQHGTHLLDDSLLIFANRGAGSTESAALEFDLDGNLINTFDLTLGMDFMGDVQRLPSGNTLITVVNRIYELSPSQEVLLEITHPELSFGYVEFRRNLYGSADDVAQ